MEDSIREDEPPSKYAEKAIALLIDAEKIRDHRFRFTEYRRILGNLQLISYQWGYQDGVDDSCPQDS